MREERRAQAAVACAVLLASAALTWHAGRQAAPPSFDEAWYLEVSFRFWHTLRERGMLAFLHEWTQAFRFKAPLISLLPLPAYAALGPSYHAAVLANLPAIAILALSLYRLGRRYFSETAGALAAILALLCPLTAHLSRLYFVECWLTALTALFIWRLAESEGLSRQRSVPAVGIIAGLGLLTKVLFPLTSLSPAAMLLYENAPPWKVLERRLLRAAAIAGAAALTWYGPNLVYVAGYAYQASIGDIAAKYVSGSAYTAEALFRFWGPLVRDGLSWPLTLALAASLSTLGYRRVIVEPGLRLSLCWLLPTLLVASLGRSKDLRFVAPALPAAALALAGTLDLLSRGKRWRVPLMGLVLALPLDLFSRQAFGRSLLPETTWAPAVTDYGGPPRPAGAWDAAVLPREIARSIGGPAVVVVGAEHRRLNANLLAAWAARDRLPLGFVHYGHMEGRAEMAVARIAEKDATHILLVDGLPEDELLPSVVQVDTEIRMLLQQGLLPFRRRETIDFGPGVSCELWERTGPIRMVGIIRQ